MPIDDVPISQAVEKARFIPSLWRRFEQPAYLFLSVANVFDMLAHEEVERQLVAYDSGQDLKLDTHHLRLFLNYVIFGKLKRGRDYTNEKAHAEEDHRETH